MSARTTMSNPEWLLIWEVFAYFNNNGLFDKDPSKYNWLKKLIVNNRNGLTEKDRFYLSQLKEKYLTSKA